MKYLVTLYLVSQACFPGLLADLRFNEEKDVHIPKSLSDKQLVSVSNLYDPSYFNTALKKILIPRVVGTDGHEQVKNFLVSELEKFGWGVEEHKFQAKTPIFGNLEFTNVIGKLNPKAMRYLVLACHYDSKYFPDGEFLGATDSAVPCTIMLQIVKSLSNQLNALKNDTLSLMLIFFDGEEAFQYWSESDSIYGSRRLAKKWEKTPFPSKDSETNELDRIDLLVLLDLIGTAYPKFYSYFQSTARWHSLLVNIERRLKHLEVIQPAEPVRFLEKSSFSGIEDDHIPFIERNVPVLHVIQNPFPRVWHTLRDNYSALDFPTIVGITKVLTAFVLSYLSGGTPQ